MSMFMNDVVKCVTVSASSKSVHVHHLAVMKRILILDFLFGWSLHSAPIILFPLFPQVFFLSLT